jgi:hypothetical protein
VNEAERGELRLIAARELASLAGCAVLLLMLHPGVHRWLEHQAWRIRQQARRGQVAEDAAVAELRRDISRYEHGEVTW